MMSKYFLAGLNTTGRVTKPVIHTAGAVCAYGLGVMAGVVKGAADAIGLTPVIKRGVVLARKAYHEAAGPEATCGPQE